MSRLSCCARALSVLPALALFTLACADRTGPTSPLPPRTAPRAARQATNTAGATVMRDLPLFAVAFGGGPPTNLVVLAGFAHPLTAAAAGCADPSAPADVVPGTAKDVITPPGGVNVRNERVQTPVVVLRYTAGLLTDPCQIVGAPVVATGTATYVFGATDITSEGPGATVVRASVRGTVTLTSGGQARLTGRSRVVVRPDGTVVRDVETVTLTPL